MNRIVTVSANQSRSTLFNTVLFLSLSLSTVSCGGGVGTAPPIISAPAIPAVEETPSDFNAFAVSSNGKIDIKGEFVTDGPLSDIYSNDVISTGKEKAVFTGDLISAVAIDTGNSRQKPDPSEGYSFRVVSERVKINVKTVGDVLSNSPSLEKSKPISEGVLENDAARGGMVLSGKEIYIGNPLKVEGDLYIDADKVTIGAPLLVKGNVIATGNLSVDLSSPFEDAVVVDGNFTAKDLTVVGKVNVGGNFTTEGSFDLVGSLVVNGSITFKGKTKIAYVDTIYKAALFSAQQYFGETMLLHSQIFKNVKGQNTVALFTFVKGYIQSSEAILLEKIRAKDVVLEEYYSVVIGASSQFASELVKYEGVAPYYYGKIRVVDLLKEKGYENLEVIEAINSPLENFYLTFRQKGGESIGTYLISGVQRTPTNELVELTETGRAEMVVAIDNAGQTIQDHIAEGNRQAEQVLALNPETTQKQKALLAAEEFPRPALNETASPEELRTKEWRGSKSLPEESREVDVMVEEMGDTTEGGGKQKCCKRLRRLIKKIIKFIVHPCDKHVRKSFIEGVNEGTDDVWTKKIAVLNIEDSNCGNISAAMILRYHGYNKKNSLYQAAADDVPNPDAVARQEGLNQRTWPFGYWKLPLVHQLRNAMNTSSSVGTMPWKIVPGVLQVLRQHNLDGTAAWLYPFTLDITNWSLFHIFNNQVQSNRPPMVLVWNPGSWASPGLQAHYMPVLGTKREFYTGLVCVFLPGQHWLYVHSTWGIGDKRWYRFDRWSSPLALYDGMTMNVY